MTGETFTAFSTSVPVIPTLFFTGRIITHIKSPLLKWRWQESNLLDLLQILMVSRICSIHKLRSAELFATKKRSARSHRTAPPLKIYD
jgi:hypothetical protein